MQRSISPRSFHKGSFSPHKKFLNRLALQVKYSRPSLCLVMGEQRSHFTLPGCTAPMSGVLVASGILLGIGFVGLIGEQKTLNS